MSPAPIENILIVDDEPGMVDLLEVWLPEDYEAVTASTAEAALEKFSSSIDAVLLDRGLVSMDGTDLASEIRDRTADIPIAYISAKRPDIDALETGFDDYLTKPIDEQDLLSTLEYFEVLYQLDGSQRRYVKTLRQQAVIYNTTNEIPRGRIDELQSTIETCQSEIDDFPNELKELNTIGIAEPSPNSALLNTIAEPNP